MQSRECESQIKVMRKTTWLEGDASDVRWLATSDHEQILFGMDWIALVGGTPSQLARKHIRFYLASMHTSFDQRSAVIGLATEVSRVPAELTAYSAAALFAAAFQQETVACLIILDEKQCWMVAAHQGQVLIQTDRWFESVGQARQAIEAIEQRFPMLRLYSYHLGEQDAMPSWMFAPYSQEAKLSRTRPLLGRARQMIFWVMFLTFTLAYVWFKHVEIASSTLPQEENAKVQLLHHWQKMLSSQPVHGEEEVFKLVSTWNHVPVAPGGWRLERIDCHPENSGWRCIVAFRRIHILASAESLIQSLPRAWKPEFVPLDQASVSFALTAESRWLEPSRTTSQTSWISHLQKIRTAFESIQIGPPLSMVHLDESATDPHELKEARAFAHSWKKRSVQIRGPLRSIPMLRGWDMPAWWRHVSLELRDADQATPGKSRYMLTMTGEMYEREN